MFRTFRVLVLTSRQTDGQMAAVEQGECEQWMETWSLGWNQKPTSDQSRTSLRSKLNEWACQGKGGRIFTYRCKMSFQWFLWVLRSPDAISNVSFSLCSALRFYAFVCSLLLLINPCQFISDRMIFMLFVVAVITCNHLCSASLAAFTHLHLRFSH